MKALAISTAAVLAIGCAASPPAPQVIDAAAGDCDVSPGGDWLLGRWSHPYNTLVIRREGSALVYAWERVEGAHSDKWGDKAPATASGVVTRIAGCSVEMKGSYTWSSSRAIVGRDLIHKLKLVRPTVMAGQWYGAGRTWLDVSWHKE